MLRIRMSESGLIRTESERLSASANQEIKRYYLAAARPAS